MEERAGERRFVIQNGLSSILPMNERGTASSALRAPSPPVGEKDGKRGSPVVPVGRLHPC
jgi:hypothetical protein